MTDRSVSIGQTVLSEGDGNLRDGTALRKLLREANERICVVHATLLNPLESYELLCECDRPDCFERVLVPVPVYERIRTDGRHFVVAPRHGRASGAGATYCLELS